MYQGGDFGDLVEHVFDNVITRPWLPNNQKNHRTCDITQSWTFSNFQNSSCDAIFHHRSRKNLAQITITVTMIALGSGVYTGHNAAGEVFSHAEHTKVWNYAKLFVVEVPFKVALLAKSKI